MRSYDAVSSLLSALDDRQLDALLERATPLGVGIGGACSLLDVDGVRVFVKRVPLTDLQLEHPMSTANLFGLPPFLQYGIGSAGFGAWRELAAHKMTTEWVLDGSHGGFPLMYHWRVRPGATPSADPDELIQYWGGSPPVRARFEALRHPSASLVLFLQYLPHTLHDWFNAPVDRGLRGCRRGVRDGGPRTARGHGLHGLPKPAALRRPLREHPDRWRTPAHESAEQATRLLGGRLPAAATTI